MKLSMDQVREIEYYGQANIEGHEYRYKDYEAKSEIWEGDNLIMRIDNGKALDDPARLEEVQKMANYMNTTTGVIWTEDEIREAYEQFKSEMENPADSFEEYLENLLRAGEMEEVIYVVRDREAGNIIEKVGSIEEGEDLIKEYEELDRHDGNYTENFYEVVRL